MFNADGKLSEADHRDVSALQGLGAEAGRDFPAIGLQLPL